MNKEKNLNLKKKKQVNDHQMFMDYFHSILSYANF